MTTWRFGLLGENIQYSKSPAIFTAIGRHLNLAIDFDLIESTGDALPELLPALTTSDYAGLSVTIPFKRFVLSLVDEIDHEARLIGAANAIQFQSQQTVAQNTDWLGFLQPLEQLDVDTSHVLMLGSGGAADAVVYALRQRYGARQYTVSGRSEQNVRAFAERHANNLDVQITPLVSSAPFSLVINCSPVGGFRDPEGIAWPDWVKFAERAIYYDLNYNLTNANLKRAKAAGATVIDGRAMLVAQAVESFRRWTGREVPFDPIYSAVFGSEGNNA